MRIRTELCTSSLRGTIPSLPFLILTSLQTHNHANTSSLKRLKIITKPGLVVLHGTAIKAIKGLVALTALGIDWTEDDTVKTTMNGISNITFIKRTRVSN